jgi:hypothetical protein
MVMHNNTPSSRYYPVTKKDQGRAIKKNTNADNHEEDIDTHTHSSRYVPAGGRSKFTEFFQNMDNVRDNGLKSN